MEVVSQVLVLQCGKILFQLWKTHRTFANSKTKVEEPIPNTLKFRTIKESELDMKKN
jgi:hypothetical protein